MGVQQDNVFPREKIFTLLCSIISGISGLGTFILATIWCLYFLSRIRELSRKIHYLKKQTEERCYEELTNAKVDYIKSIFITAICFFEIKSIIFAVIIVIFRTVIPDEKIDGCPVPSFIELIYHIPIFRILVSLLLTSNIIFLSLNHILTFYLSKAYEGTRVINLTSGTKLLFILMSIQIVIVWISSVYWELFLYTITLIAMTLFPIHLCLYVKYSRRLYMLLKRRRLDAWFEDPDSYKKLVGMCKDYKTGSILYTVCVILIFFAIVFSSITTFVKLISEPGCSTKLVLFVPINTNNLSDTNNYILNVFFSKVLVHILLTIAVCFLFSLHLLVLGKLIKRALNRRKVYKNCKSYYQQEGFQPLIGSN